jgi:glycolate oxidase iron-sulfur subunit
VNFLYPYLGESLINVLRRLGFEVILPVGEVCCGTPFRTLGLEEEAAEVARKNFDIFSKLNVEAVLSLCPTCTLTLKSEYPKLVGQGIDSATDISTFLLDVMNFTGCDSPYKNAVYHDPCHLKYGLGIAREPRKIIKNIGIDLIQTYGDRCCGFAGLFSLSNRQLSRELLNNCLREYAKEKSEAIITSCPGCIMQISGEVSDKPVLHLIEIIEEALMPSS